MEKTRLNKGEKFPIKNRSEGYRKNDQSDLGKVSNFWGPERGFGRYATRKQKKQGETLYRTPPQAYDGREKKKGQ